MTTLRNLPDNDTLALSVLKAQEQGLSAVVGRYHDGQGEILIFTDTEAAAAYKDYVVGGLEEVGSFKHSVKAFRDPISGDMVEVEVTVAYGRR